MFFWGIKLIHKKTYDVVSICNALMDLVFEVSDSDLKRMSLTKGVMKLVSQDTQEIFLEKLTGKSVQEEIGGSALNTLRALAHLKKRTCFAGSISKDRFGSFILQRLADLDIESHLTFVDNVATGTCLVLVTPDGERTMLTNLGASRLYTDNLVPEKQIASSRVFHFCGYQWDSTAQQGAIKKALGVARESKTLISFDLADPHVVQVNRDQFLELINSGVDIVFANSKEAKLLFAQDHNYFLSFFSRSDCIVVLKLGSEGALIQKGDLQVRIDPVEQEVVDTTAAGDMFAAGFLYGFTSGLSLSECGKIAAILAGDVISRKGAVISSVVLSSIKDKYGLKNREFLSCYES